MRQINRDGESLPLRPARPPRRVALIAAASFGLALAGCAGSNPLVASDLPANRHEVPEQAPSTNVIPEYGGTLKTDAEKKKEMEELEAAGKAHAKDTQSAIASRKY
ncbi:MAG: hypothetical protein AB7O39_03640 [Flavobacteriaceae bacterium]